MNKFTYEEVKMYIENFGYKLLSTEYINSKTKLLVQCDKGHKYEVVFDSFKTGNRCPYCSKKHKYTYEEVKEYIEQFNYKLLSDGYINVNEPLLIQCDNKHEPYKTTFHNFKQGKRCPKCAIISVRDKQKHSYEYVKKYIESFGYELLSDEYINAYVKLLVKCPNPSHKSYNVTFHSFQRGTRCPECANNQKHSYDYVKEYIESFGYKLLSDEYVNNQTKLLLQCPNGHKWKAIYNSFKQGHRCPICNISKGERKIINYLEENNIEYIYEKKFYGLIGVGGGNLSYDFYLPKYNLLIEYQGKQHETQIGQFGNFERQQEHDTRKRDYAKDNGYNLLEIWYWDFDNIEEILEKYLK